MLFDWIVTGHTLDESQTHAVMVSQRRVFTAAGGVQE